MGISGTPRPCSRYCLDKPNPKGYARQWIGCSYPKPLGPWSTYSPTITARRRGESWVARVRISYVSSEAEPISIAPLKNIPLQRERAFG